MGLQNPQLLSIASVPLDGYLRSGNIPIPPTSDTDYLFGSIYLPSASPLGMRAYYPDTRSQQVVQNFNSAYPGLEWMQPFWAYGANGPVIYEIVQGAPGMTIGSKLARDPVTGYFVPGTWYGCLKWENPIAGRYRIGIRATDQLGQMVYWIFDLFVSTDRHFFMALVATGSGLGTSPSNYASYSNTIVGQTTLSPSKGKVLHIKGDDFPATSGISADTTWMAASLVNMPGETPIFHQQIHNRSPNISLYGLKLQAVGTGDFGVVGNGSVGNGNFGVWRCEFDECYKVGTDNNNNSCIGFNKAGSSFGRETIFVSECTFRNSTSLHGYDYYSIADNVWARNQLIITNGTSLLLNSWIFPKMMVKSSEIMFNTANVPSLTNTTESAVDVMQIYNAWDQGHAISFDLTHKIEYNFIRTGGSPVFKGNGADNLSPLPSVVKNCTKRNTFMGGPVTAVNYTSPSPDRQQFFESNICVNSAGGIATPPSSSAWFFKTGTNAEGSSGIVDTDGHFLNPADPNRGKTGRDIWRPE